MANEVFNVDGVASGVQKLGGITVNTGGVGVNRSQFYSPDDVELINISEITDKWDDRFDDVRYYTGDAST